MQSGHGITEVRSRRLGGRRTAVAIQVLFGAWVAAVLAELFVVDPWFGLNLSSSDGSDVQLRWGIASTLIAVAIAVTSAAWLVRVAGAAVRVIATSQHAGFLFGLWAGLLWLYVVSDIVFAEVARAQRIGGPETRWPVLLSAGLGIAAAVAGIGLIRSVMTHAASTAQATQ